LFGNAPKLGKLKPDLRLLRMSRLVQRGLLLISLIRRSPSQASS